MKRKPMKAAALWQRSHHFAMRRVPGPKLGASFHDQEVWERKFVLLQTGYEAGWRAAKRSKAK